MTRLDSLSAHQLDVVLARNVRSRAELQQQVLRALVAIDQHTERIEQLLEQRARVS